MVASEALVSVGEYLRMTAKPAFEYRDGVLKQKPMPTWKHSLLQSRILQLILNGYRMYLAGAELTVCVREERYLIPDVAMQRRDRVQDPYPTSPVPLCVEILSPGDRMSETIAKCEEYHTWGVPMTWIVDPETRTAWEFASGGRLHEIPAGGALTAAEVTIPIAAIFEILE